MNDNKNMALWSSVFITDPKNVKPITGKSYKGNSPKPYWLTTRATEVFGPCGIGWGVQVVDQGFQQCGADDVLHWATVKVWYVYDGKRGEIEQMGGTKACYRSSANKLIVDEDAAKKSITDGMVKCLSMIGFAGDIFSGRWDDSKYVESAHEHYHGNQQKQPAANQAPPQRTLEQEYQQALLDIQNAENKQVLVNAWNYFKTTKYVDQIKASTAAKRDQMGWVD